MKYLLFIVFLLLFNSCGGSSGGSKKKHKFSAHLIDGYISDANIKIDKSGIILKELNTDSNGYFSYTNTKNDLLYVKSSSGIDKHYDEVSESIFYGVLIKNQNNIISPLSSLLWAYHSNNANAKYKIARDIIKTKLGLTKDFLSFNPISNISNPESSLIIQKMLIFNFVSQLVNSALGASYEDAFYYSAYSGLKKDISFLHSEAFIHDLSNNLVLSYPYLNFAKTKLKLMALRDAISYFISEIYYFQADNDITLKQNYKSAYILAYPIVQEMKLLDKVEDNVSGDALAFFNSLNHKISGFQAHDVIDGLKLSGGFRGILSKIKNINRAVQSIKPSFFAQEFLSRDSLTVYANTYNAIALSTVSGAPSQEPFKLNMIKNILSLRVENNDILNENILTQIQNQLDLLITISKRDAISTGVEKILHAKIIKNNKKFFLDQVSTINNLFSINEVLSQKIAYVDDSILNVINANSLIVNRENISKMKDFQEAKKQEKDISTQLRATPVDNYIVEFAKKLTLVKSKIKLLKKEIKYSLIELEIKNTNSKLNYIQDQTLKTKLSYSAIELAQEKNKEKINLDSLKSGVAYNQNTVNKLKDILSNASSLADALVEAKKDKIKNQQQNAKQSILNQASRALDKKIIAINLNIETKQKKYEEKLREESKKLSNGESISNDIFSINILEASLNALKKSLETIIIKKEDLESYRRPIIPVLTITLSGLKTCYTKNENNIFTAITNEINGTTTTVTATNIPYNTTFNNNSLKKKADTGVEYYSMLLGSYDVNISATSSSSTISPKTTTASFEIKKYCDDRSEAYNAPLGIPNLSIIETPDLETDKDIPNPNDDNKPPVTDTKPPENN